MSSVNWQSVADAHNASCPSESLRNAAAILLSKAHLIGPLLSPQRTPSDEFQRAYKFLTYNEPARLMAVVEERLLAFERGGRKPLARYNAWNYVVGAFDLWLNRARVFYMAGGLLEGALRARLDARMTDHYGPTWPQNSEAIPSPVLPLVRGDGTSEKLGMIRRLVDEWDFHGSSTSISLAEAIQSVLRTEAKPTQTGAQLVGHLTFGELRSFFQAKRLWSRGPKLDSLFQESSSGKPPLRDQVQQSLDVIHGMRNNVAHYLRPIAVSNEDRSDSATSKEKNQTSFTSSLYHMAKLARWMNVDLQHFYESVDTRESTELALLIEDPLVVERAAPTERSCMASGCAITQPLAFLMRAAPTTTNDLMPGVGTYACLHHRVERRAKIHRPHGE